MNVSTRRVTGIDCLGTRKSVAFGAINVLVQKLNMYHALVPSDNNIIYGIVAKYQSDNQ